VRISAQLAQTIRDKNCLFREVNGIAVDHFILPIRNQPTVVQSKCHV